MDCRQSCYWHSGLWEQQHFTVYGNECHQCRGVLHRFGNPYFLPRYFVSGASAVLYLLRFTDTIGGSHQ